MTAQLLDNPVRHYEWGSATVLPTLLGVPNPTGEAWAEVWMGAHPDDPSRLPDGSSLATVVPDLPFLVKLLAAARPLSIQAHPSLAQAEEGFAREEAAGVPHAAPERSYKDRNHKPELLVALAPVEALCGFRPADDVLALAARLAVPELDRLLAPLRGDDGSSALVAVLGALLRLPEPERTALVDAVVDAAVGATRPHPSDPLGWVGRLAAQAPGDPGVLGPLLLQLVHLEPGEAVFLDAGVLHAYLVGTGVEVQASSDNVLRGALTTKHVDVDELLAVVRQDAGRDPRVRPRTVAPGLDAYDVPVADFGVWRARPEPGAPVTAPAVGHRIVVCVEGQVEVDQVTLRPGRSAFVPAGTGRLVLSGSGTAFVTAAGSR